MPQTELRMPQTELRMPQTDIRMLQNDFWKPAWMHFMMHCMSHIMHYTCMIQADATLPLSKLFIKMGLIYKKLSSQSNAAARLRSVCIKQQWRQTFKATNHERLNYLNNPPHAPP
jgi:hypothetical protein